MSDQPARFQFRPSGPMLGMLAILGLFAVLLAQKGMLGAFLSLRNMQVILHQSSIPMVVALGMLMIVISGGIDLSVGSVAALVTVMCMKTYEWQLDEGVSVFQASIACIGAGLLTGVTAGVFNGLVVTWLKVSPFVATLGMMSIARGLALWLTGKNRLTFKRNPPEWVNSLNRLESDLLIFDPGVWSVVVLAVIVAAFLRFHVLGRYCYAIGSSEATARLCGVNVERSKVLIYAFAGLLTGWAGILVFTHISAGDPTTSTGLELEVIAAVVIGGASLSGGQGTVIGTLLGVFILNILENVLAFLSAPVDLKSVVIGVVVIGNTALSQWQRRSTSGA